jgi:hypothetical protein
MIVASLTILVARTWRDSSLSHSLGQLASDPQPFALEVPIR